MIAAVLASGTAATAVFQQAGTENVHRNAIIVILLGGVIAFAKDVQSFLTPPPPPPNHTLTS